MNTINELILEEMITNEPKRLLPAEQYLKTFKVSKCKTIDKEVFFLILEHLIEWEKMEIKVAINNVTKDYTTSIDYFKENFVEYEVEQD